jgi:hypothetical protein
MAFGFMDVEEKPPRAPRRFSCHSDEINSLGCESALAYPRYALVLLVVQNYSSTLIFEVTEGRQCR